MMVQPVPGSGVWQTSEANTNLPAPCARGRRLERAISLGGIDHLSASVLYLSQQLNGLSGYRCGIVVTHGPSAQIVDAARDGRLRLITSPALLDEFEAVIN